MLIFNLPQIDSLRLPARYLKITCYNFILTRLFAVKIHFRATKKPNTMPARNATPASPARFVHHFLCSCMNHVKPRRAWAEGLSVAPHSACKSMHPLHASLFTNRLARKRALKGRSAEIKKPLFTAAVVVNAGCGRMNRSAR